MKKTRVLGIPLGRRFSHSAVNVGTENPVTRVEQSQSELIEPAYNSQMGSPSGTTRYELARRLYEARQQ